MVKNYGIHDEWKDLNKVNDIDIKAVDGEIDSIKVNGEEAGGGGSGDLTVANVSLTMIGQHYADLMGSCCVVEDDEYFSSAFIDQEVNSVILYKGKARIFVNNLEGTLTVSGDAVYDELSETIRITGDCTITIS